MQKRDTRIFSNWSNASDYRTTEESFDMIALHGAKLHDALTEPYKNKVNKSDGKLTSDQKFYAKRWELICLSYLLQLERRGTSLRNVF